MLKKSFLILTLLFAAVSNTTAFNAYYYLSKKDTLLTSSMDTAYTHDKTQKVIVDTLKPIFTNMKIDTLESPILLNKKNINRSDYRYLGDLINYLPFGFLENLGSLGEPNEFSLFGLGFNNITLLLDGVEINERHTNAIDLYTLRSELVDSIYIPSPAKAFLFGVKNNPVAVKIYSFDKITAKPYSRIRYYQAPNNEGSIDGFFNIYPFKKFNLYGGFQNSSVSSNYPNSEYGLWNATIKARYLLNNNFNFVFSYNYSKSTADLNGGVNYSYLESKYSTSEAERILYSPFEAIVNYENRYQKITRHLFNIKILARLSSGQIARINTYYNSHLTEFRQNEKSANRIYDNDRNKSYGVNFLLPLKYKAFSLAISGNAESSSLKLNSINLDKNLSAYSTSALTGFFLIPNYLNLDLFAKYSNYDGSSAIGFGSEINSRPNENIFLNCGVAKYSLNKSVEELVLLKANSPSSRGVKTLFAKITYKKQRAAVTLSFFHNAFNSYEYWVKRDSSGSLKLKGNYLLCYRSKKQSGLNLSGRLRFYKFLLQSNFSYYFNEKKSLREIPTFTLFGGFYYVDTLFNRNLNLKAGINIYLNGEQSFYKYEFQFRRNIFYSFNKTLGITLLSNKYMKRNWRLDLFLAGTIQKRATIYLTLENVFNNKYFIVPYYPMPGITFRFGVAWEFFN